MDSIKVKEEVATLTEDKGHASHEAFKNEYERKLAL